MTAAKKLAEGWTSVEEGVVREVTRGEARGGRSAERLRVELASGLVDARRARSCLVPPGAGDSVLCVAASDGHYVLAVLSARDEAAPTRVVAEGPLELASRTAGVTVSAPTRVALAAGGEVAVSSVELSIRATRGSISVDELGYLGRMVQANVTKAVVVARELDTFAERIAQRVRRAFRFVEELDQVRAGAVDVRAESLLALRGENTVISSRTLTKVDGEQIHLG